MHRAGQFAALALAGLASAYAAGAQGQAAQPSGQAASQQQPRPEVAKTHLKVGDKAPDFKLKGHDGKTYKLSSYRGKKNVVLAFYVLAHTGG